VLASLQAGEIAQPDRDAVQPSPQGELDCAGLSSFQSDLFGTFTEHGEFVEFWSSGEIRDARSLGDDDAQGLAADGEGLVADLSELTAPDVYVSGLEGIVGLFQFELDYFVFYAVDSTTPPNRERYSEALVLIYNGEMNAAEACPDEIDDLGGFVFTDPANLEDAISS